MVKPLMSCIGRRCRITTTMIHRRKTQPLRYHPYGNNTQSSSSSSTRPTTTTTTTTTSTTKNNTHTHPLHKSFAIGTTAGFGGSLAGMGGGFISIPLMTSKLGLTQHAAHGTALFAVAATGCAGALGYAQDDYDAVDIETATVVALTGMMSARMGAKIAATLGQETLKRCMGALMISVAPLVGLKGWIVERYGGRTEEEEMMMRLWEGGLRCDDDDDGCGERKGGGTSQSFVEHLAPMGLLGLGSGFISGMFGVGGGAVIVPALTIFTDKTHRQALGTSLCAMTFPALVGVATHSQKGHFFPRVAVPLAVGSFVGAYVGGMAACRYVREDALRYGFAGLMMTLGVRALIKR